VYRNSPVPKFMTRPKLMLIRPDGYLKYNEYPTSNAYEYAYKTIVPSGRTSPIGNVGFLSVVIEILNVAPNVLGNRRDVRSVLVDPIVMRYFPAAFAALSIQSPIFLYPSALNHK